MPPLTISAENLAYGLGILTDAVRSVSGVLTGDFPGVLVEEVLESGSR
jgi:hypothetical protein